MLVRDESGGTVGVGIEHDRAIAHRLRHMHEHAAELAAAEHAERRAGGDLRQRRADGGRLLAGGHFRSAVIARAASDWRTRNASSFARSDTSVVASRATAKSAALAAPALPIANVATGMPRGICTIE